MKRGAKQCFLHKLEDELNAWDLKLAELEVKARHAKAEIRAEFEIELEDLECERAVAQEKLRELRQHGEWAWEDLKDSADKTWGDLRQAIKRSASLFQ